MHQMIAELPPWDVSSCSGFHPVWHHMNWLRVVQRVFFMAYHMFRQIIATFYVSKSPFLILVSCHHFSVLCYNCHLLQTVSIIANSCFMLYVKKKEKYNLPSDFSFSVLSLLNLVLKFSNLWAIKIGSDSNTVLGLSF